MVGGMISGQLPEARKFVVRTLVLSSEGLKSSLQTIWSAVKRNRVFIGICAYSAYSHKNPVSGFDPISYLGTGKMPIPQENSLFVEQASCLFLRMVQDIRFNRFKLKPQPYLKAALQLVVCAAHRLQLLQFLTVAA